MRILLVEDDTSLGDTIAAWLRLDGHAVDWVQRGDTAETALMTHQYDCVLLDRGLPGLSGDAVLARLRSGPAPTLVPVLLITAYNSLADRVEGLDMGADDYLIKPFDMEEMSARIRAAVRRSVQQAASGLAHSAPCGRIVLDAAGKQVTLDGAPVALTAREFNVLHALMLRKAQIVTRAQIEQALYGWGDEVESNAIEVYIHNLRKKLGAGAIVTVRGLGYRLGQDGD